MNASISVVNSWENATIYIHVLDANDNHPVWVIPTYPPNTVADKYFAIISNRTGSAESVITIQVSFM